MIFTTRDLDILRFLRWCRFVLAEDLTGVFSKGEVQNLEILRLIKLYQPAQAYTLTAAGNRLLDAAFPKLPAAVAPAYKAADTIRRIRQAKLMLTAYQAGVSVFTADVSALCEQAMFLPMIARNRGSNPWGSTRVAALLHTGDLMCAIHWVSPGIGCVALTDELTAFQNHTAAIPAKQRAIIFAASSYPNFPLPRLVFAFHVDTEGKISGCRMGVAADEKPTMETAMYRYPFSNVSGTRGDICIGANALPKYKTPHALASLPTFLLSISNGDHSFNALNNKLGLQYRDLLEHLKDKEPLYYYSDVLIPNGKTLKDFIGGYDRLSLSEKIRAGAEVSELVKRLTGRNYPVFFDNMESVDDLSNIRPTSQMILAKCVRNAELSVRAGGTAMPKAA